MEDSYKSIESIAQGFYKDKGSKFISIVYPVKNESDVRNILVHLKKKYHDARHHCYAYRIGEYKDKHRANDDGEPSGTAGKPIYGQILSFDITNILIVVIRYFGGTLLGTSGLIKAYKNAARDALKKAKIIDFTIDDEVNLHLNYTEINDVMRLVNFFKCKIKQQEFAEKCTLRVTVRKSNTQSFIKKLKGIPNANFEIIE